jgi:hypothetical protein
MARLFHGKTFLIPETVKRVADNTRTALCRDLGGSVTAEVVNNHTVVQPVKRCQAPGYLG